MTATAPTNETTETKTAEATSTTTHAEDIDRATWWSLLKQAVKGSDHDYTEGSLNRAVFLLSVPMILEMLMESIFGILDVFWVGRLGPDAVAAVGLTESLLTIVFGLAMGLSMATTALVARRIGEKNPDLAARTAVQAIVVGVLASAPFALAGLVWSRELLELMGAPAPVIEMGWTYTAWMLGGNASILLLFLINAVFRGAGDASVAMRSLWLANAVNLVLDPCLIFGLGPFPEMGITGAAIGTTVGRTVGVLYQFLALGSKSGRFQVQRAHLRFDPSVALHLVRVSVGGTVQFLIATASWLGLVRILTPFGSAALAGYTIAIRIIIVAILPSWGMTNAVATLVGQNLGAKKPDRAEKSVWITGLYNMVFLILVAVVFIVWPDRWWASSPPTRPCWRSAPTCLRVVSYGYAFYAWGMVMVQAFNGAGDTTTPTWINLFCYWLFQIPLALGLARGLEMGPLGVFLAITIAESVVAVVGIVMFRRGRWKEQVV